jgi:uncharacterized damage-inducible protein DinB
MPNNTRIQSAFQRIEFARQYTNRFLPGLSDAEWFWHPHEFVTHVAWQVGHVAVSQYNLCLRRSRGRTSVDESLIPDSFIEHFKLGSVPVAESAAYPPREEIERVFEAVHRQVLTELSGRTDDELDVPVAQPHPVFKTKLEAIEYSDKHELVHAGQIAMLRRLMGKPALR